MMACVDTPRIHAKHHTKGQIQVIFGPMFSGKTTELIRRMKRYQIANYTCLVVKYANDIRYEKMTLATHDKQTLAAVSAVELMSLQQEAMNFEVIGIDEGQFFPDVVEFSEFMANAGKTVIVAALDGTYQRKGFGNILNLVPLAESVIKLTAVCMKCNQEACYTKRKGAETALEVIGGADKYMAVCRQCFESPQKLVAEDQSVPFEATPTPSPFTSLKNAPSRQLFRSPGCSPIKVGPPAHW